MGEGVGVAPLPPLPLPPAVPRSLQSHVCCVTIRYCRFFFLIPPRTPVGTTLAIQRYQAPRGHHIGWSDSLMYKSLITGPPPVRWCALIGSKTKASGVLSVDEAKGIYEGWKFYTAETRFMVHTSSLAKENKEKTTSTTTTIQFHSNHLWLVWCF